MIEDGGNDASRYNDAIREGAQLAAEHTGRYAVAAAYLTTMVASEATLGHGDDFQATQVLLTCVMVGQTVKQYRTAHKRFRYLGD